MVKCESCTAYLNQNQLMSPHLDVDNEVVRNYRGFALVSTVAMICMNVLARRLCKFAEDKILMEA